MLQFKKNVTFEKSKSQLTKILSFTEKTTYSFLLKVY